MAYYYNFPSHWTINTFHIIFTLFINKIFRITHCFVWIGKTVRHLETLGKYRTELLQFFTFLLNLKWKKFFPIWNYPFMVLMRGKKFILRLHKKKYEKVLNVFIIFISYHYTHANKHNHRENIFLLGKYNSTTQCPEIFKRFAFRIEAITLATLTPARVHFN